MARTIIDHLMCQRPKFWLTRGKTPGLETVMKSINQLLLSSPGKRLTVQVTDNGLRIGDQQLTDSRYVAGELASQGITALVLEGDFLTDALIGLFRRVRQGKVFINKPGYIAVRSRGVLHISSKPKFEEKCLRLNKTAEEIRALLMEMFSHSRGSGHSGGSLSVVDIITAVFFGAMYYDFQNDKWPGRDFFILSKGHAAPALYSLFIKTGLIGREHLPTLRHLGSILQGHPEAGHTPGVEVSTGSLGQGLSSAVGLAIGLKMLGRNSRVFCVIGDGEKQEGQITEAITLAAALGLDNLVIIEDFNGLQIDGLTGEVDITARSVEARQKWWQGNGAATQIVDGHEIADLLTALSATAQVGRQPHVIIAKTIKGKGVSFMEETARQGSPAWHGKVPDQEGLDLAAAEIKDRLDNLFPADLATDQASVVAGERAGLISLTDVNLLPPFSDLVIPAGGCHEPGEKVALRTAAAQFVIAAAAANRHVVTLGIDLSDSVLPGVRQTLGVFSANPYLAGMEAREYKVGLDGRHVQVGIAETNACGVSAGLSLLGFLPFLGSFEIFTLRMIEQIRNTLAPDRLPVIITGSHAGLGVGEDGRSHQPFEVLGILTNIPNMLVAEPVDANETHEVLRLIMQGLKDGSLKGPFYVRTSRQKLPVLNRAYTLRPDQALYTLKEAKDDPQLVIVANGALASRALEAADELESREKPVPTRVLTMTIPTALNVQKGLEQLLPPFVARLTMQDGLTRTLAELISRETARDRREGTSPAKIASIGMTGFGESGTDKELYDKHYPLSLVLQRAEHVVAAQKEFNAQWLKRPRKKKPPVT